MSQHSLNIPNESGAAFRADVNNALQALASLNSGTSAPSTTYAYMPWYDTTNGLLKIRNGANSAWIIVGPLADSSQHVIYTNNTARVYVDSSGNVGIGVPTPGYALDVSGDINASGNIRIGGTALVNAGYNFINAGTTSNSGDTYTATPSPAISGYSAGQLFNTLINNTNTTTTPTVNYNSQGAKTVKKQIGGGKVALSIGDMQANTYALLSYDGTDLILVNPRANSQAADIASASTLVLTSATGDYGHITGTTGISAITLPQGRWFTTVFDGILTITNGASLILPGAADIITAAGDIALWRGEASGVVRCVGYIKAKNSPIAIIPQNSKSAAYTTVLEDAGKHLYHPSADTTARTWTIDSNANVPYPVGTAITFVNDSSAGVITIGITSDTLVLAGSGATGNRTLAANGMATAIKMTSTRWMIAGTGLT